MTSKKTRLFHKNPNGKRYIYTYRRELKSRGFLVLISNEKVTYTTLNHVLKLTLLLFVETEKVTDVI